MFTECLRPSGGRWATRESWALRRQNTKMGTHNSRRRGCKGGGLRLFEIDVMLDYVWGLKVSTQVDY